MMKLWRSTQLLQITIGETVVLQIYDIKLWHGKTDTDTTNLVQTFRILMLIKYSKHICSSGNGGTTSTNTSGTIRKSRTSLVLSLLSFKTGTGSRIITRNRVCYKNERWWSGLTLYICEYNRLSSLRCLCKLFRGFCNPMVELGTSTTVGGLVQIRRYTYYLYCFQVQGFSQFGNYNKRKMVLMILDFTPKLKEYGSMTGVCIQILFKTNLQTNPLDLQRTESTNGEQERIWR